MVIKGAVHSMDIYLELHVFGAVPVRKKYEILDLDHCMNYSLSPFVPKNLVSRDGFGGLISRQLAHLHTPG